MFKNPKPQLEKRCMGISHVANMLRSFKIIHNCVPSVEKAIRDWIHLDFSCNFACLWCPLCRYFLYDSIFRSIRRSILEQLLLSLNPGIVTSDGGGVSLSYMVMGCTSNMSYSALPLQSNDTK